LGLSWAGIGNKRFLGMDYYPNNQWISLLPIPRVSCWANFMFVFLKQRFCFSRASRRGAGTGCKALYAMMNLLSIVYFILRNVPYSEGKELKFKCLFD